jgi:acyl-coenzyme A thioesterase PaaI-like protein
LKANFLAAALGPLTAEGRAQRAGRSLIFAEGDVSDQRGVTLAKGSGTFKLVYPAGTRE